MVSRVKKRMFWKEVKRVRKGEQVKDVNGQIVSDGVEVRRRWARVFSEYTTTF